MTNRRGSSGGPITHTAECPPSLAKQCFPVPFRFIDQDVPDEPRQYRTPNLQGPTWHTTEISIQNVKGSVRKQNLVKETWGGLQNGTFGFNCSVLLDQPLCLTLGRFRKFEQSRSVSEVLRKSFSVSGFSVPENLEEPGLFLTIHPHAGRLSSYTFEVKDGKTTVFFKSIRYAENGDAIKTSHV